MDLEKKWRGASWKNWNDSNENAPMDAWYHTEGQEKKCQNNQFNQIFIVKYRCQNATETIMENYKKWELALCLTTWNVTSHACRYSL